MIKKALAVILALVFCLPLASCKKDKEVPKDEEVINYYDFEMTDYISVPALSDIVVPMTKLDAEWEKACLKIRLDSTSYEKIEEDFVKAELYDKLVINFAPAESFKSTLTEEQISALTRQGYEIILGSGQLVAEYIDPSDITKNTESFEAQLVGSIVTQRVDIKVTLDKSFAYTDSMGRENYSLAGKVCYITADVKELYKGELPLLSASLVSRYTSNQYTTVESYKEYIYGYFKGVLAYNAFFEAVTLKDSYPEEALENARVTYITEKINSEFANTQLDDEDIKSLYDKYYGEADSYAKKAVFERMVLEYLFEECQIKMTDGQYYEALKSDFDANFMSYYMYYGITTMSDYEDYMGKENLLLQYKYEKLLDVLPQKITFK